MSRIRNTARKVGPESSRRSSFTATEAKNEFGLLLERAIQGDAVVITRHETPKAVLISMEEYASLTQAPERALNLLTAEFDAMYERMQSSTARTAMKNAFNATPQQMGKSAVRAARKRG